MRSSVAVLGLCLLASAGCRKNPKSVKDQTATLNKSKSTAEKLKAVENLKRIASEDAKNALAAALPTQPAKVKAEIAEALAELKDKGSAQAIASALILEAPEGDKDSDAANEKMSRALGDLGVKVSGDGLMKLAKGSKSVYARLEAVNALGRTGESAAVPMLTELALDPKTEFPIRKKSVAALAGINDPSAIPVYLKMMFAGPSASEFSNESTYGLFRLRSAAFARTLALLTEKDKETFAETKKMNVVKEAVLARVAQVEGDLQDPRAVGALVKLLKYEGSDPAASMAVQAAATDALGRMRARGAVGALVALLTAEGRDKIVTSLVQIGDASAVPKLVACAEVGGWDDRDACIQGVAMLGGTRELKYFDGWVKGEPKKFDQACGDGEYGEVDCAKEKPAEIEKRTKYINGYKAVLEKVGGCADAACLEAALNDPDPVAQERAAYDLARRKATDSLGKLLEAAQRPVKPDEGAKRAARLAAILAGEWLAERDEEARAKVEGALEGLKKQVDQESRSGMTAEGAEELRRLADILERGRDAAPAGAAAEEVKPEEPEKPAPPPPKKAPPKKGGKRGKR